MAALADSQKEISEVFAEKRADFHTLSLELWHNPENSYKEFRALDVLCCFLEKEGFEVDKKFVSATGFRAIYKSSDDSPDGRGLNAGFICEYDAVADLGHAAGHNLQTASSIAAAVAVKKCLEKNILKGQVSCYVRWLGP